MHFLALRGIWTVCKLGYTCGPWRGGTETVLSMAILGSTVRTLQRLWLWNNKNTQNTFLIIRKKIVPLNVSVGKIHYLSPFSFSISIKKSINQNWPANKNTTNNQSWSENYFLFPSLQGMIRALVGTKHKTIILTSTTTTTAAQKNTTKKPTFQVWTMRGSYMIAEKKNHI